MKILVSLSDACWKPKLSQSSLTDGILLKEINGFWEFKSIAVGVTSSWPGNMKDFSTIIKGQRSGGNNCFVQITRNRRYDSTFTPHWPCLAGPGVFGENFRQVTVTLKTNICAATTFQVHCCTMDHSNQSSSFKILARVYLLKS